MPETPTLPALTLLPPLAPEVPENSATFRQDLTAQVDRITKKALDRLEGAIDALKPYELTLAAGILLDKRKDLEVTRAPASVHNTIVVNGLTRADALRFLTDGQQQEAPPAAPGSSPAPKSAPKSPARAPRPLPRQAAQPISATPKKGFTIMAHPVAPGPQNSGVFLPATSQPDSLAGAPGERLSKPGSLSPELLRASGAVLVAAGPVSSNGTDHGQAVSAEQASSSTLGHAGADLRSWGSLAGSGGGSALSSLSSQPMAQGDQVSSQGHHHLNTGAALQAHPGAEARAATGLSQASDTQGTSKEGLT